MIRVVSALLFIGLSLAGLATIHALSGGAAPQIDPRLFDLSALLAIAALLAIYFASDGLRLYFVLRTLGERVSLKDLLDSSFKCNG